jgi:hypothetical protein
MSTPKRSTKSKPAKRARPKSDWALILEAKTQEGFLAHLALLARVSRKVLDLRGWEAAERVLTPSVVMCRHFCAKAESASEYDFVARMEKALAPILLPLEKKSKRPWTAALDIDGIKRLYEEQDRRAEAQAKARVERAKKAIAARARAKARARTRRAEAKP